MRKSSKMKETIKRDLEKGKEEIREKSVIKYALTFILGIIATLIIQKFIYNYYPSSFSGEKLEEYFFSQIQSEIDSDVMLQAIHSDVYEDNIYYSNKSIIMNGIYTNKNNENMEPPFFAIFEQGEKCLWDFLLDTEAKYQLAYYVESEPVEAGQHIYEYIDMEFHDLDKDGTDEIILDFRTIHATTDSIYTIVFKYKDNVWNLIAPDFGDLQNDIPDEYEIVLTEMPIYARLADTKYSIPGMSRGGSLDFPVNRKFDFANFCYKIPLLKENQGLMAIDTYAYVMLRFEGLNLVIDNSWNFGEILIGESVGIEEIYNYYGIQVNGQVLYTQP